jgi:hypothetical protein
MPDVEVDSSVLFVVLQTRRPMNQLNDTPSIMVSPFLAVCVSSTNAIIASAVFVIATAFATASRRA